MPSLAICGMSYVSVSIKLDDENYIEKMENCMNDCFDILINDNNCHRNAVVMYYDFEKAESTFGVVNPRGLCKWLFGILKETKEYYDAKLECQIEMEVFGSKTHSIINLLTFAHKGVCTDSELLKYRFATKDRDTLLTIKGLLRMCEDKKDLDKLLEQIENEDDMWDCFEHVYTKQGSKNEMIKKKKIPREKIPREKIPREEIPREKTLSKKEKEKLKKQKAKEANKLRDQEKKDKAKLAEQQAKHFEKQQKERERKRIETARKKKLALLKK
jgi:hypothetical protein